MPDFPPGPIAGVRVLDFTTGAAAFAGRVLADLGADVLKIEPPNGDPALHRPPFLDGPGTPSLFYWHINLGKRIQRGDLHATESLLADADIALVSTMPGDQPPAIDRSAHPRLITGTISGFGEGPRRNWITTELIAQAAGGMMYLIGEPDREPLRMYGEQAHQLAAMHLVSGLLLALRERDRSGAGQAVEVTLHEAVASTIDMVPVAYTYEQRVLRRVGDLHWNLAWANIPCSDGYASLTWRSGVTTWGQMVSLLNEDNATDDLADPRYQEQIYRESRIPHIRAVLTAWAGTRTRDEVVSRGQGHGMSWSKIFNPTDILTDPHLAARSFFQPIPGPDGTLLPASGQPARLSRTPWVVGGRGSGVGGQGSGAGGQGPGTGGQSRRSHAPVAADPRPLFSGEASQSRRSDAPVATAAGSQFSGDPDRPVDHDALTPALSLAREREQDVAAHPSLFTLHSSDALTPALSLARRELGASWSSSNQDPAVATGSRSGDRSYPPADRSGRGDLLAEGDQPVAPAQNPEPRTQSPQPSTFNFQLSTAIQPSAFSLQPLRGVRVLDFTWVLAGPYCTRLLADFGAEVIKVTTAERIGLINGYFVTWNKSKRGIALNFDHPEAKDLARQLASIADVVVDNFSARVMKSWGLGEETLTAHRPDLIVAHLSGMGHTGPYSHMRSLALTAQAMGGPTYLTGYPDLRPTGVGISYSDHVAGITLANAILAALNHRARTGEGQVIDCSMLESTVAMQGTAFIEAALGRQPERAANALQRAPEFDDLPAGVFRCRGDDRWIAIEATTLAARDALAGLVGTAATKDAIEHGLVAWAAGQEPNEAARQLQALGIAASVVADAEDLFERDENLLARGFWQHVEHERFGQIVYDAPVPKLSATPAALSRPTPILGTDNAYVYRNILGMRDADYQRLEAAGVFS